MGNTQANPAAASAPRPVRVPQHPPGELAVSAGDLVLSLTNLSLEQLQKRLDHDNAKVQSMANEVRRAKVRLADALGMTALMKGGCSEKDVWTSQGATAYGTFAIETLREADAGIANIEAVRATVMEKAEVVLLTLNEEDPETREDVKAAIMIMHILRRALYAHIAKLRFVEKHNGSTEEQFLKQLVAIYKAQEVITPGHPWYEPIERALRALGNSNFVVKCLAGIGLAALGACVVVGLAHLIPAVAFTLTPLGVMLVAGFGAAGAVLTAKGIKNMLEKRRLKRIKMAATQQLFNNTNPSFLLQMLNQTETDYKDKSLREIYDVMKANDYGTAFFLTEDVSVYLGRIKQDVCSVCTDAFSVGQVVQVCQRGHVLHQHCYMHMVGAGRVSCPQCKGVFNPVAVTITPGVGLRLEMPALP